MFRAPIKKEVYILCWYSFDSKSEFVYFCEMLYFGMSLKILKTSLYN
jgi:hypothetical protein